MFHISQRWKQNYMINVDDFDPKYLLHQRVLSMKIQKYQLCFHKSGGPEDGSSNVEQSVACRSLSL